MATIVNRRRGTTAQHAGFTGALGEITIDTDKDIAVIHDGVTAGGFPLAGTMFANIFTASQTISRQSADNIANGLDFSKRGTVGDATAAVVSGVALGVVTFRGWDTATLASGGNIRLVTTEAWTPVAHGSSLLFQTVPIGSVTITTHATLNSTAFTLAVPLNMGTHLINNVVDPIAAQDAATKNYVDTAIAAGAPPFSDSTALVEGSGDPTKLMRFEVDGFTAATTRVLTPPNADITLAGINIAQTFAEDQTFGKRILLPDTISAAVGGIYFGGTIAVHNFGTDNFFAGVGAGNLTMTGVRNSVFGDVAGAALTSGNDNSFFGAAAGQSNQTGISNAFFGRRAGYTNNANYNSFFGTSAGLSNSTGTNNVFVGFNAGFSNANGANNSFFGSGAGLNNGDAINNSFFGRNAGYANTGGSYNSFFGFHAGYAVQTGSGNILFGHQAGDNITDGANNLLIGFDIDAANPSGVGQLSIGNLIFGTGLDGTGTTISNGNVGIAVVTPHSGLQVARSFALPYRAISGTDTFAATDYTINATSGTFTLNLPTAVGITGRIYVAKNSGAGSITLDPAGAELIDGSATATIVAGAALTVQSSGTGWIII